ncbi:glycosyl transferase [Thermoplasma volcanium GSS1]|uniref:Glycosyl transferase n=1 Tax=Thermoplasma volcanium (strain ATCC 51530 / DSM 4299 / JCM 9571 / NBRC 15438 / GSS1) TaxID=273116 RepID=Q97BB0_THEVO|nr:glycosyltransferase [Thermoplasma volcanium]BAB59689.1 glycosyl transferase [Thermoplasma volcanium GSS1]
MDEEGASVVITIKNEAKNIQKLLDSLFNNDYEHFEVVVVDDMSNDGTEGIVKKYDKVKYIRTRCSRGEGRNIGAMNSSFENILFTDGDAIVSNGWIGGMVSVLNNGFEIAIGKTVYTGKKRYIQDRVKIYFNGIEITAPSVNLAYKKRAFFSLGGFDKRFVTAEDIDLNLRAAMSGFKFGFCNECVVYAKVRDSFISFLKQAFWNGYGRAQLEEKHPGMLKKTDIRLGHNFYDFMHMSAGAAGYLLYKLR